MLIFFYEVTFEKCEIVRQHAIFLSFSFSFLHYGIVTDPGFLSFFNTKAHSSPVLFEKKNQISGYTDLFTFVVLKKCHLPSLLTT